MPSAVDEHVDPVPFRDCLIDQLGQVLVGLVRAGDADAAQLLRQSFAFARGGENGHLEAVRRQSTGCGRAHAAASGRDDSYFFYTHIRLLTKPGAPRFPEEWVIYSSRGSRVRTSSRSVN